MHDAFQCFKKSLCFFGAAHIRLCDNFDKRYAAAIVVHSGASASVMQQLTRILFHMNACDTDALFLSIRNNINIAFLADRQIKLRYLICLGQIGIIITLTIHLGKVRNCAIGREACPRCIFYDLLVEHRQHTRHTSANGTAVCIGLSPEFVFAGTKYFCFGCKLDVYLEPDHSFVCHHCSPPLNVGAPMGVSACSSAYAVRSMTCSPSGFAIN